MAKKKTTTTEITNAEVLRIPVSLIESDPDLDVRPTFGKENTDKQKQSLTELADSIVANGQILPGAVLAIPKVEGDPSQGERYVLIDGSRRKAAITMNAAAGYTDTMDCKVFRGDTPADALRKALAANIHREDFTPMQIALDIQKVRERMEKADGVAPSFAVVARYLGVAKPTVIKYTALLQYPDEIKASIHSGEISMHAAKELLDNTIKEQQAEVRKLAAEKAKAEKEAAKGTPAPAEASTEGEAPAEGTEAPAEPSGDAGVVQAKHITEAARELQAQQKDRPRTRSQVVAFFSAVAESELYGYLNSPSRTFAREFVRWSAGDQKIGDNRMVRLFQELVESSGEGTPNATERRAIEDAAAAAKQREAEKILRQQKKAKKESPATTEAA